MWLHQYLLACSLGFRNVFLEEGTLFICGVATGNKNELTWRRRRSDTERGMYFNWKVVRFLPWFKLGDTPLPEAQQGLAKPCLAELITLCPVLVTGRETRRGIQEPTDDKRSIVKAVLSQAP